MSVSHVSLFLFCFGLFWSSPFLAHVDQRILQQQYNQLLRSVLEVLSCNKPTDMFRFGVENVLSLWVLLSILLIIDTRAGPICTVCLFSPSLKLEKVCV